MRSHSFALRAARIAAVVFALAVLAWLAVAAQRRARPAPIDPAPAPSDAPAAASPALGAPPPAAVEPAFLFSSKSGRIVVPVAPPTFLPTSKSVAPDTMKPFAPPVPVTEPPQPATKPPQDG
jgi:hypothetical protein